MKCTRAGNTTDEVIGVRTGHLDSVVRLQSPFRVYSKLLFAKFVNCMIFVLFLYKSKMHPLILNKLYYNLCMWSDGYICGGVCCLA